MEIGLVKKINLREEMQKAYLDYAVSYTHLTLPTTPYV